MYMIHTGEPGRNPYSWEDTPAERELRQTLDQLASGFGDTAVSSLVGLSADVLTPEIPFDANANPGVIESIMDNGGYYVVDRKLPVIGTSVYISQRRRYQLDALGEHEAIEPTYLYMGMAAQLDQPGVAIEFSVPTRLADNGPPAPRTAAELSPPQAMISVGDGVEPKQLIEMARLSLELSDDPEHVKFRKGLRGSIAATEGLFDALGVSSAPVDAKDSHNRTVVLDENAMRTTTSWLNAQF